MSSYFPPDLTAAIDNPWGGGTAPQQLHPIFNYVPMNYVQPMFFQVRPPHYIQPIQIELPEKMFFPKLNMVSYVAKVDKVKEVEIQIRVVDHQIGILNEQINLMNQAKEALEAELDKLQTKARKSKG
jgi:hypothetical protein